VKRFSTTIAGFVAVGALSLLSLRATAQHFQIIVHEEADIKDLITKLTNGDGRASVETKDVYKKDRDGKAALLVTGEGGDGQKFNPNIPGWAFKIVKDPKAKDEFRYITFAWKKVGGTGIQLQLSAGGDWGHRYHAGANEKNWNPSWNPSIQVSPDIPKEWTLVTRDVWEDWKDMTLTGIAFTAWSLQHGIWDHVVLHQTKEDPLALLAVEPKGKLASAWAELKVAK